MRLLVAILLLPGCFVGRLYATPWPEPVETHRVVTSDGCQLDLRHVRPIGTQTHPRPVVLAHGVITNGRNCDVDASHSLARYLAAHGFDVWIPSLRGTGDSEKRFLPGLTADESSFDAYVTRDLPAVIDYVRTNTRAPEVDYVGHSLGGLILYAYLAQGGKGVGRAVTLGSPVRIHWTGRLEELARTGARLARAASWAPIRTVIMCTLPIQGTLDGPLEHMMISPENTTIETWHKLLAVGTDDIPSALAMQLADWLQRDRFESMDHRIDYLEGLRQVTVPMMIVAGKIDGTAPPWMVRPAYDVLGSIEKEWLVLGEANGQSADYNHMDMLLGEHAASDVFAPVAEFLGR